eukprot:TRINITY_DN9713_c0_g1_i1.p1 TRINITY_DN9713_c0_g1~~TRINITY_DN9713_c0_g1_i1.p1  ORF type:complete len:250 (+),score=68.58 TRINITY_DN9713_c0_g1_i1:127-876(+)
MAPAAPRPRTAQLLWLLAVAAAADVPTGEYWFGNGCMWRVQHVLTTQFEEAAPFHRTGAALTATAGYAGGAGEPTPTCYPNRANRSVYEAYGDAEVVTVAVGDAEALAAAGKAYFNDFISLGPLGPHGGDVWARPDYLDAGPPYRAVIGVPGGSGSAGAMAVLRRPDVNVRNLTFTPGAGKDADTLGTNTVWVYDTAAFPFRPAELCMQYHDDAGAVYPAQYHAIRDARVAAGTLHETGCPTPYPCEPV